MSTFHDTEARTLAGTKSNPTVWADGFGVWHASVAISTPSRQAREARELIWAELMMRDVDPSYRARFHVTREHVTNHGTVTYREV